MITKEMALRRRRSATSAGGGDWPGVFLEWIESSGTQYVITPYRITPSINSYSTTLYISDAIIATAAINGSRSSSSYHGNYLILLSTSIRLAWLGQGSSVPVKPALFNSFFNVLFTPDGIEWAGEWIEKTNGEASDEYIGDNFAIGTILTVGDPFATNVHQRISPYVFKIHKTKELVGAPFPFRHEDGRIGMMDIISKEFYENKGTGSFIAGPVAENQNPTV